LPGTGLSAGSAPASIALFSAIEHPSVLDNARLFKAAGCAVHQIKPDTDGRVSPDAFGRALEKALSRDGADNASQSRRLRLRLVAVMAVNNETGAIQDIPALVGVLRAFCREHGLPPVHFHCDAVQAIGKTALDLAACGIDSAALSAHKLGGPRGIGLLYLRRKLETLSTGGHQEGGIRSGTENLFGALGLALALENQAAASIPPDASTAAVTAAVTAAIARFVRLITALRTLPACSTIPADRTENDPRFSPYILQLRCPGIPGEVMVRALDDLGIAVSTGSACSSNSPRRVVLEAMGLAPSHAFEGFRISQGWSTTDKDIDALVDGIRRVLEQTARIQTKG
jgi:cysteine desulfurase